MTINIEKALFVLGAQKAGTTWLRKQLLTHPGMALSPIKEFHYFSEKHLPGVADWSADHRLEQLNDYERANAAEIKTLVTSSRMLSEENYRKLLGAHPGKYVGDFSPEYCMLPESALREISSLASGVTKCVMVLRHPVERLVSHLSMKREKLIDVNHLRILEKGDGFLARSRYEAIIPTLQKCFRDLLLIDFKDISMDPARVMRGVLKYLDLDEGADAYISAANLHAKVFETPVKLTMNDFPADVQSFIQKELEQSIGFYERLFQAHQFY